MSDLTEFLLARIAEDESAIEAATFQFPTPWVNRLLAECEAKRKIVKNAETVFDEPPIDDFSRGWDIGAGIAVQYLAQVYADHPDYQEEWRHHDPHV